MHETSTRHLPSWNTIVAGVWLKRKVAVEGSLSLAQSETSTSRLALSRTNARLPFLLVRFVVLIWAYFSYVEEERASLPLKKQRKNDCQHASNCCFCTYVQLAESSNLALRRHSLPRDLPLVSQFHTPRLELSAGKMGVPRKWACQAGVPRTLAQAQALSS